VFKIKNTEQKATIIKHIGVDKIISEIPNIKVIDEVNTQSNDGKPIKYQVLQFELDSVDVRFVKVQDHSVGKETFIGVPILKETEKCKGAIAWTFRLNEKDYVLEKET
jgi:hypothetical protein